MPLDDLFSGPRPRRRGPDTGFDGLFSGEGGYRDRVRSQSPMARHLAAQGRDGDSLVAHINPAEADMLKRAGGRGTINPRTGMLEFAPELVYQDGTYTWNDGSAVQTADSGADYGGTGTTSDRRTPRAMSAGGNPEAADSEAYANRGTEAAPSGGQATGATNPAYASLYGSVERDPSGAVGSWVRDQIAQDPSQANAYGMDWNKATGWTDADYARRAAEMGMEPSAEERQAEREAQQRTFEEASARANSGANKPWQQSGGIYGDAPSRNRASAGGSGGGGTDRNNNGVIEGTEAPGTVVNPDGTITFPGGYTKGALEDPYTTPGKSVYQVNPGIQGAPPSYAWGSAPGGALPAGAWPETFMDPIRGVTTYNAAPPPNANGQWLNPQFLPWDVRNGGTGDPYVPWTPEWAAQQALEGNGYAFDALVGAGYDPAKYIPGYNPGMAGSLKAGQGTNTSGLSNMAGYDRGWKAEGFYQTKDGVWQTMEGVLVIPQGNGLFLDTMFGKLRNQQGIFVNPDGSPIITEYNAGYPQGSSDPWRVFGSSAANAMMGPYAGVDLGSLNDGNNTPIRGTYGGGTPTPISGANVRDIRGNVWSGNPTPQSMGGGPTGPASGGGDSGGGPQTPDPVNPQPIGGSGAPVYVPYIPAPNRRGGYASGFGIDELFI